MVFTQATYTSCTLDIGCTQFSRIFENIIICMRRKGISFPRGAIVYSEFVFMPG